MTEDSASKRPVRIDAVERVAIIRMCAPSDRNALDVAMRDALRDAIDSVNASDRFDGMVLAGNHRFFSVGGDLRTMGPMTPDAGKARIIAAHALPRCIHASHKPVVAAVEGICAGAGLAVAAICDVIVAGSRARFITSFEKVGLMPDLGATYSIPQRMGQQAARRLFLFGGALDAEAAQANGLSDYLAESVEAVPLATELVAKLSRIAPGTRHAVRSIFRAPPATLEEALRLEIERQPKLYASADLQEGIAAFTENRPPVWRDG